MLRGKGSDRYGATPVLPDRRRLGRPGSRMPVDQLLLGGRASRARPLRALGTTAVIPLEPSDEAQGRGRSRVSLPDTRPGHRPITCFPDRQRDHRRGHFAGASSDAGPVAAELDGRRGPRGRNGRQRHIGGARVAVCSVGYRAASRIPDAGAGAGVQFQLQPRTHERGIHHSGPMPREAEQDRGEGQRPGVVEKDVRRRRSLILIAGAEGPAPAYRWQHRSRTASPPMALPPLAVSLSGTPRAPRSGYVEPATANSEADRCTPQARVR
jgi:hypothetical protein